MHRKIFKSIMSAMQKPGSTNARPGSTADRELQIATCALLLEIARADNEFSPAEEQKIQQLMREHFTLSEEAFFEIKKLTEKKLKGSIDLWHFAKTIKDQYSYKQRQIIIEMLWAVIYTDETLDAHEDYLVHKLATVLNLNHRELIDAKLKILGQRKTKSTTTRTAGGLISP